MAGLASVPVLLGSVGANVVRLRMVLEDLLQDADSQGPGNPLGTLEQPRAWLPSLRLAHTALR
jgi:hypothetical protein